MDEKLCCAEEPKRTIGDLARQNTELMNNMEVLINSLNEYFFNEIKEEKERVDARCMREEINLQNCKLKSMLEILQQIKSGLI